MNESKARNIVINLLALAKSSTFPGEKINAKKAADRLIEKFNLTDLKENTVVAKDAIQPFFEYPKPRYAPPPEEQPIPEKDYSHLKPHCLSCLRAISEAEYAFYRCNACGNSSQNLFILKEIDPGSFEDEFNFFNKIRYNESFWDPIDGREIKYINTRIK